MKYHYFAYGSNISREVMQDTCSVPRFLGVGYVCHYRLAFTRMSQKNHPGSGVADIVEQDGFKVWGVLWEIDQKSLDNLKHKEGTNDQDNQAYKQINIEVCIGHHSFKAITFTVTHKNFEIPPHKNYIENIINAAKSYQNGETKFPKYYIEFLEYLASENPNLFREGFLVSSTHLRKEAQGMNLIKLSSSLKDKYPKRNLCIVEYRKKLCPAKIAYSENVERNICQLDQTIREALGIKGTELYGHYINFSLLDEKKNIFATIKPIKPTRLILPLEKASIRDSEKMICVLHEKAFRILGIEEGDYLVISTVIKNSRGLPEIKKISRRVFSGTAEVILKDGLIEQKYPISRKFYLDLDGRLELGLARDETEIPIVLYPNLLKLFIRHLRYYGTTLFLGLLTLPSLIKELAEILSLSPSFGFLLGFLLAIVSSLILTVLDLRSRVQY